MAKIIGVTHRDTATGNFERVDIVINEDVTMHLRVLSRRECTTQLLFVNKLAGETTHEAELDYEHVRALRAACDEILDGHAHALRLAIKLRESKP